MKPGMFVCRCLLFFTGFFFSVVLRAQLPVGVSGGWQKTGPGGGGWTHVTVFSPLHRDRFIVQCDMTGSYLTTDGGRSFRQINFPGGAGTYAFDPSDDRIMYAGGAGLFQSIDGGDHWKCLFPDSTHFTRGRFDGDEGDFSFAISGAGAVVPARGLSAICVDPFSRGRIYFTAGNVFYFRDDQSQWQKLALPAPANLLFTDTLLLRETVLIITPAAVLAFNKKTKRLTERKMPAALTPTFSPAAGSTRSGKNILYALHDLADRPIAEYHRTEVWTSRNAGMSWEKATDSLLHNERSGGAGFSAVNCAAGNADKAYLISTLYPEKFPDRTALWYGALSTDDGGEHWWWSWKGGGGSGAYGVPDGQPAGNLSDGWVNAAFGKEFILGSYNGIFPGDGNVATLSDWYRLVKTTDGGKTWQQLYSHAVTDSSYHTTGIDVTTCYGVHFDPFDSNHLATSYTDIGYWHSFDNGKSWLRSVRGVPQAWINTCYWVVFDPAVKGRCWSAWGGLHDLPRTKMTRVPGWQHRMQGGICVSVNGGRSWAPVSTGPGTGAIPVSLLIDPTSPPGSRTLYAAVFNKGVYKSTDDGRSWIARNEGLGENKSAFELSRGRDGTLYLVVSLIPLLKGEKPTGRFISGALYRSIDGAATWQRVTVKPDPFFPSGVTIDPTDPKKLYVAAWANMDTYDVTGRGAGVPRFPNTRTDLGGGIWYSGDAGAHWRQLFDSTKFVYAVTVDSAHPGRLYCNTFSKAAYRSDDAGKTWLPLRGYDFQRGHRVVVDRNDPDQVYLTTFGSGVWHGRPIVDAGPGKN